MRRTVTTLRIQQAQQLRNVHADLNVYSRAEVIKIEHPVRGDDTRAWGPPFAKYTDESKDGPGESAYYLAVCCHGYAEVFLLMFFKR